MKFESEKCSFASSAEANCSADVADMDVLNTEVDKRQTEAILYGIVIVFIVLLFIVYSGYCIYRRWGIRICSSIFCCNFCGQQQNNQSNPTINTVSNLVQTRFTDRPPAYVEAVGNCAFRPDTPPPSYADAIKT